MTIEEHNGIINNLLALTENNTEVQALALQLQDDYKEINAREEENKNKITQLTTERDNYAKLNNELWLRQMTTGEKPTIQQTETEPPTKRKFEDLNFD